MVINLLVPHVYKGRNAVHCGYEQVGQGEGEKEVISNCPHRLVSWRRHSYHVSLKWSFYWKAISSAFSIWYFLSDNELAYNDPEDAAVPDDGHHEDQGEADGPQAGGDRPGLCVFPGTRSTSRDFLLTRRHFYHTFVRSGCRRGWTPWLVTDWTWSSWESRGWTGPGAATG